MLYFLITRDNAGTQPREGCKRKLFRGASDKQQLKFLSARP
jgi:hypothetical protein